VWEMRFSPLKTGVNQSDMANTRGRNTQEPETGPERIERLPGELESAMYTGTSDGEPAPGPAELGPLPDREEVLEVFQEADRLIAEQSEAEPQAG